MTSSSRMKLAELTSGIGAVALGVGLGAIVSPWVSSFSVVILATGAVAHGFGMWDKHRMEDTSPTTAWWIRALYWVCWLLLLGLAIVIGARVLS